MNRSGHACALLGDPRRLMHLAVGRLLASCPRMLLNSTKKELSRTAPFTGAIHGGVPAAHCQHCAFTVVGLPPCHYSWFQCGSAAKSGKVSHCIRGGVKASFLSWHHQNNVLLFTKGYATASQCFTCMMSLCIKSRNLSRSCMRSECCIARLSHLSVGYSIEELAAASDYTCDEKNKCPMCRSWPP